MYYRTIDIDSFDVVFTAECNLPPGDSVVATEEAGGAVSVHSHSRVMHPWFRSTFGKVAHTGLVDDV